jgi:hypothetical protein
MRVPAPLLILALCCCLCACAGGPDSSRADGVAESPSTGPSLEERLLDSVPEELAPAFEAVVQSIEDRDEARARRALDRVLIRNPRGRALKLARALERILDGRALCASLDLRLQADEVEGQPARYSLTLVASQPGARAVSLHVGGARLRQALWIVDPSGAEKHALRQEPLILPESLLLSPGATLRVDLGELELPAPAGLLALSSRVQLDILPGELIDGTGRSLPAQVIPVRPLELVRLAEFLATQTVEPGEVASYAAHGRIFVPALMERAVRVSPARRGEALDLLAPLVSEMGLGELGRLVPALRWLSRETGPGGDPVAWRAWMKARAAGFSSRGDEDHLELPAD